MIKGSRASDVQRNDDSVESPTRQVLKRPASMIDVSEATSSTNSAKVLSRSERQDDDDLLGAYMSPTKLASLSRPERKRYREKKRRSDVNKGFDELMNLLLEIDPEIRAEAEERARRGQWKGVSSQEETILSRVDLISRTATVLRRLNGENEQCKAVISQLVQDASRRNNVTHHLRDEVSRSHSYDRGVRLND
jgi:hypothetical protein